MQSSRGGKTAQNTKSPATQNVQVTTAGRMKCQPEATRGSSTIFGFLLWILDSLSGASERLGWVDAQWSEGCRHQLSAAKEGKQEAVPEQHPIDGLS